MAAPPGPVQGQSQQLARQPEKDMAPVFQELNIAALQGRAIELQGVIGRILVTFQTQPSIKWSEALAQFAVINLQLFNLVEDMKAVLRMFVVRPKNVTGETAAVLPIMLSSKLLPEMEADNGKLVGSTLAPMAHLPLQLQAERLQRQVEGVKMACEVAERAIAEGRKKHSLDGRRAPLTSGPKMDAARMARLVEQEKLLRNAVLSGEGLQLRADQQEKPAALPPHLSRSVDTLGTLGASPATGPGLPRAPSSAALRRSNVSQTESPATPYVRTPLVGTPGGPSPTAAPLPGSTPGQVAAPGAALKAGSPMLTIPSPATRSPGTLSPSSLAAGAARVAPQGQLQDVGLQGKHHAQQQLLQQRHDQEQQLLQQHQHQQLQQLQQRQRQLLEQSGRGQMPATGAEGGAPGAPQHAAPASNIMPSQAGLGPTLAGQPGGGITYGVAATAGTGAAPAQQKFVGQASSYTQQQR